MERSDKPITVVKIYVL
uniref:Uncharacterized protein n=1 Tax=Anguilla anguilla TaxID=7936 RepID=A0A0E9Q757_ANGAN